MKNLFLIILLGLLSIPSFGRVQYELPKDIEFHGSVEIGEGRSALYPLEGYIQGMQVSITFYVDLPDATVTITSENGEKMEVRGVAFSDSNAEIFNVSSYPKGTYTLLITTPRGTELYGSFIIE